MADCDVSGYDKANVVRFFQSLEIGRTLIGRLPASNQVAPPPPPSAPKATLPSRANQQLDMFGNAPEPGETVELRAGYVTVTDETTLAALVADCRSVGAFAFDTETTGTSVFRRPMHWHFYRLPCPASLVCPHHPSAGRGLAGGDRSSASSEQLFADANIQKSAHNAKFDIESLLGIGIGVNGLTFDSMLAASLLDKRRGLKELAFYELQLSELPVTIDQLIGKGKNQTTSRYRRYRGSHQLCWERRRLHLN
jgi:DNA polymerase-1